MAIRRQAECKLWFHFEHEEFYGIFDQDFFINPAEPDVGINQPWCELDSGPENLVIYDDEDTEVMATAGYHTKMKAAFMDMYESCKGRGILQTQCFESCEGAEGRRC